MDEPCNCGAEDCRRCFPFSSVERDEDKDWQTILEDQKEVDYDPDYRG